MLTGSTRIRLIRLMHGEPGHNVATIAQALDISRPYASQELRRIQSRGFLKRIHQGSSLIYHFCPDPQVPTAAPLLKAIRHALTTLPAARDAEMSRIASGLAHERRIALVNTLLRSPKSSVELLNEIPMSWCCGQLHFQTLLASGFVVQTRQRYQFHTPSHPLGRALTELLRQGISR